MKKRKPSPPDPYKPVKFNSSLGPVAYGSSLGKYTGTINKETALERQGFAMTTRFNNAIKDKEGLINFIQRRELLRGPSDYYKTQKEYLQNEIAEIKKQRDQALSNNQRVTELITNNAGKMVPTAVFRLELGLPNTPVKPEGIVGERPQPTAEPEAPAPPPAEQGAPAPPPAEEGAPAPTAEEGAPPAESEEEAPTPEGSETSSETEEDPEIRDKRLGVYGILLNERKHGESKRKILEKVMEYDEQELDEIIGDYYPDEVENLKATIPESALQKFEMAFTGQH